MQALEVNSANENKWRNYKEELLQTKESLHQFVKSHSLEIMVPMGKKAFLRGKLQHTNEITVSHGSSVFSDCSSGQANDFIENRIKNCDYQLKALEKEKELFT
jgi:unconventional prefoldin RPB5 interactor 1